MKEKLHVKEKINHNKHSYKNSNKIKYSDNNNNMILYISNHYLHLNRRQTSNKLRR